MGKIVFYEDRDLGGRRHECTGDCVDLHSAFDRCRSVRVESGAFVVYDRPGYTGTQQLMRKGEYSDYVGMTGMTDCVRSCHMIPMHSGGYKMRLYEHFDMKGEMMELTDDCPNLAERFHASNFSSCDVVDGHWLMHLQANYRGRHFYVRPGQYRSFSEWSAGNSRLGSVRRLADL